MAKDKSKKSKSKKSETSESKPAIMSPAEMAKAHKKESAERKEAASFRFPEGEDFDGKIIKAEDTLSQKKKTPCYEITVQTKEKNQKGKKVDIIIRFMKNEKSMRFFYAFLELAGADLSKLRYKKQETLDEDIQEHLETLEEENAKIVFNCAWQQESTFNNYYVNVCDQVLADGEDEDEKGDDSDSDSEDDGEEETSSDSEDNGDDGDEDDDDSNENSDSAFDDDDDD